VKAAAQLLLACVVLAAIKAAVMEILVVTAIGGIVCLVQRPRETLAAISVLAATVAFVAYPGVTVGTTCAIVALSRLIEQKSRRSPKETLRRRLPTPKSPPARHRDLSPAEKSSASASRAVHRPTTALSVEALHLSSCPFKPSQCWRRWIALTCRQHRPHKKLTTPAVTCRDASASVQRGSFQYILPQVRFNHPPEGN